MTCSRVGVTVVVLAQLGAWGCTHDAEHVGGTRTESLVYLVHNEVFRTSLDGNTKVSLGRVGYDKYRSGWPRTLPDGRVAVLGDEWGVIFPYISNEDGTFSQRGVTNVMIHDSIGGATVRGESRMIVTVTPWSATQATIHRVNIDENTVGRVAKQKAGQLLHPSPYDDGRILAIRTTETTSRVEIIDATEESGAGAEPVLLAEIKRPWIATQPVRLPDGRVAFLRLDADDPSPLPAGDVYLIEEDGRVRPAGYMTVIALMVVGDKLVMESGGMDGVSDLVATDLKSPPYNITRTPFVSEHLTWSD